MVGEAPQQQEGPEIEGSEDMQGPGTVHSRGQTGRRGPRSHFLCGLERPPCPSALSAQDARWPGLSDFIMPLWGTLKNEMYLTIFFFFVNSV